MHHQKRSAFVGGLRHVLEKAGRDGGGLFADDAFAGFGAGLGVEGMPVVGRRDQNRFQFRISQKFFVTLVNIEPVFRGSFLTLGINVKDAFRFDYSAFGHMLDMVSAHASVTDDADLYRAHSFLDLSPDF